MVVNQYTLFCLLAVALVIGAGYSMRKYGDMRFTQGVELTERKHQLATLERDRAERAKEKLAQDKVDELERRYEDERAKTAVIVAGLRDNADSLRNKADRLASQLREVTRTTSVMILSVYFIRASIFHVYYGHGITSSFWVWAH